MTEFETVLYTATLSLTQHADPIEKGPHYELIKEKIPHWLANASLDRLYPLKDYSLQRLGWHFTASKAQQDNLAASWIEAWTTQNTVDRQLRNVQDVYTFAEPLLKKAIKDQYSLDLNVKTTCLQIVTRKERRWYIIDTSNGTVSRTVSLLDAALHNFARHETFDKDSGYITQPDYRGHFSRPNYERVMSLEQFKTLCRELDLGALYQQHLNDILMSSEPVARNYLKSQVIASQKAAFKAAAHMAYMNKDLGVAAYAMVLRVLAGTEKKAGFYHLTLLDTPLSGILLISSDLDTATRTSKLIAYIPNDPVSPLKQYNSTVDFVVELTRKLLLNAPRLSRAATPQGTYQQFFSQFVPHAQRGHFFATLNDRLYQMKWHERGPLDPAPAWCEDPAKTPKLQGHQRKIEGELWRQLYQSSLNKILNDGRTLAVSTAQADSNERSAWWDNILQIGSDLFNAALLVITPFVPVLGELMLAYTAYKLADELLESIVELSEGQVSEAGEHFVNVLIDVVQLAAMGVGGELAKEVLYKSSPFVDSLKAVNVEGNTRLWSPDLAPYARQDLALPSEVKPDALGVREYQEHKEISVNDQRFLVEHDAQNNTYRIKHPTRPKAYSPIVEPNGSGAWVHEGEDPWTWDQAQLRSRLGHATQGLSTDEVAQACMTSGTHDSALRNMYLDLEPTPPLLADSLNRLKFYQEATQLPGKIRTSKPTGDWFTWSAQLTVEQKGWPADKAIKVFEHTDLSGDARTFPVNRAADTPALDISHQDMIAGKLPEKLVTFLNDTELATLLSEPLPDTPQARISALRNQLADNLDSTQGKIATFNHLYSTREVLDTAPAKLLQTHYPDLPSELVQRLMLRASPNDVRLMTQEQQIPLRLKHLDRELQNETRASHALEGYYNEVLQTPDTERMALNTLRLYTDALGDLQITVREQTLGGRIRCQVGREDASSKKTLLRKDNGRYEIHNPDSQATQPQYDFFNALLRTVPDGKTDYVPGQGNAFRQWLQEKLEPPVDRVTVLEPSTLRETHPRETQTLLQKPLFRRFSKLGWNEPPTSQALEARMRKLCPVLSEAQMQSIQQQLETEPGRQTLSQLESEKKVLVKHLEDWKKKAVFDRDAEPIYRKYISDQLKANWESTCPGRIIASAANPESASLDLSFGILRMYIRSLDLLPKGYFDHITHLNLSTTRLSHFDMAFLDNFPNVRELDLSGNELASLPSQATRLRNLTTLDLSGNPDMRWNERELEGLYRCSMLENLNLQDSFDLTIAPDLSRMPRLRNLGLRRTSVSEWPSGLNGTRTEPLQLDLIGTDIRTVPVYPEDSPEARTIANSWLESENLLEGDRERFRSYRRASGMNPDRTFPTADPEDKKFWIKGLPIAKQSEATELWNDLENTENSEGFFKILKMLQPPEEFGTEAALESYTQGRQDLIDRAWELMTALDGDADLRTRMFYEASAPTNCADASATVFNTMGVELLKQKILADTTPEGLATRDSRLATLAKQKWRLNEVGKIARSEIARRTNPVSQGGLGQVFGSSPGQVDEVEVYLAYQTALKNDLDLPWLSEHMTYRHLSGVTQEQVNAAKALILGNEAGDGLVDGLLGQDFWSEYVENDSQVAQARDKYQATFSLLHDELQPKQQEWSATATSPERKQALKQELTTLIRQLNQEEHGKLDITEGQVFSDEPLTQTTLNTLYQACEASYKQERRNFTRRALEGVAL